MYVCIYAYLLCMHVEYIYICVQHTRTHTLSEYQKLFLCILSHVVDEPYNLFRCKFQLGREFDLVSAKTLMPGAVLDIQ